MSCNVIDDDNNDDSDAYDNNNTNTINYVLFSQIQI